MRSFLPDVGQRNALKKKPTVQKMTADSYRPKMGMRKYGGCIFIPGIAVAMFGFSMHPAVLMAISDFEIVNFS